MFSQKSKYFLYGILTYFSLITIVAQAGSDGIFGDYFDKMTATCPLGNSVLVGFDNSTNYGARQCKTLSELLGNIFSGATIPDDSSVIGINSDGTLKYKDNIWKENGTDISYTGGKVGIGTNTPGSKLDVVGGSIKVSNGGNDIVIGGNNAGVKVNISSIGVSYFNGFVGIGTNNPGRQLDVVGNAKISGQLEVQSITLAGKNLTIPGNCFALGDVIQYNNGWICGKIPVHGICGSANGSATATYPSSGFCSSGNKVDIDTSGTDGTYNWRCDGVNGGNNPSCSARPNEIRCTMRLDDDCSNYDGHEYFNIYTTCGTFTVGRTDWGHANKFPIPGVTSCAITGDSFVGVWPGAIPNGSPHQFWFDSCDNTSYLYCGIY